MKIDNNSYSIADVRDMLTRKDLVVNHAYQRGANLWPLGARSYFIDTILMNFPFPKLFFSEYLDKTTRKVKKEIVDGQQRASTIIDFLENKFALTAVSRDFHGKRFADLSEELQHQFLTYPLPVDVIRNAERAEILEMFRRMNAYTLPLNEAERRHSTFTGAFKWFINRKVGDLSSIFSEFEIFTNRQIIRMADTELLTELIVALEQGVVRTNSVTLANMYHKYDQDFPLLESYEAKIDEVFDFITNVLGESRGTYLMRPFVVVSLFCGLMHNKYGLPGVEDKIQSPPTGTLYLDVERARDGLLTLARAHESNDVNGDLKEYVLACSGTPNTLAKRIDRVKYIYRALNAQI